MSEQTKRTSKLAIAALVLSLLFFLPLVPILGLILGIVALVTIRRDPNLSGDGLAIAAIATSAVTALLMGIMVSIAIPSFIGFVRRARTAEAEERLSFIFRQTVSYYEQVGQLPASAPVTPPTPCARASAEGRCLPDSTAWSHPTWRALGFEMTSPHYFQYEFVSDGSVFTARALGDLDDDGVFSTFERSGATTPSGTILGARGVFRHLAAE